MLEGCQIIGYDWRYLYVNDALARQGRRAREELLGHTMMEMYPGIEDTEMFAVLRRCMEKRTAHHMENEFTFPDGTTGWFELSIQPVPEGIFILSLDITERKRAEETLRLRMEQLTALSQASQTVTASLELDQVLAEIVSLASRLTTSDYTSVVLVDEEGCMSQSAENLPGVPAIEYRIRDEGFTSWIVRSRQAVVVDEIGEDGAVSPDPDEGAPRTANPHLVEAGIKSFVGLPLVVKDRLLGVLYMHSLRPRAFQGQLPVLTAFANQAAIALENARLFEEAERRAAETTALLETSLALNSLDLDSTLRTIGQHAKALFAADGCRIFLIEPDGETLRCALALHQRAEAVLALRPKLGQGVTGAIARRGEAEIVNDMVGDPRSIQVPGTPVEQEAMMFAPLEERERVIGVMSVSRLGDERPFRPADLEVLKAFASMASSAISNARLFAETSRRLERLSALHHIDTAITASMDLRVTLNVLLDQITAQLGVDAADVLLLNSHTQALEYAAGHGFRTAALQHTRLRPGEGHAGRAALERRIVNVPDLGEVENGLRRSPLLPDEGFIAYYVVPLIAKGQVKGVLELFHRKPFDPDQEWLDFLETLAGQTAIAIDNAELFKGLQRANVELALAYDTTLEGWAKALELRDRETEGHTRRVTEMTLRLARAMGMSEEELVHVRRGTLLHDIGKMGVPDSILLKPGLLTEDDWEIMRQHPAYAYEMLSPIAYLRPALDIPYCHHERWDGTGYPRGLKGEQIPLAARIFTVVDVYDALRSERPYRPAWPEEKARDYIREQAGKDFDPQVVEMFMKLEIEETPPNASLTQGSRWAKTHSGRFAV